MPGRRTDTWSLCGRLKLIFGIVALTLAVLAACPGSHNAALAGTEDTLSIQSPEERAMEQSAISFDQDPVDVNEVSPLVTNYQGIVRFEFPRGSRQTYLYSSQLMFGCIRGLDTLVSLGPGVPASSPGEPQWEMNSYAPIREISSNRNNAKYNPAARAPQEFYMAYSDTEIVKPGRNPGLYYDALENRPHIPIGIEVHQTTYAWADDYSLRFIITNFWIKNIGRETIEKGCVGIYVDPDVQYVPSRIRSFTYRRSTIELDEWPPPLKSTDDLCGFLREVPGVLPGTIDTINTAYVIDIDGKPAGSVYDNSSVTGAMGVRVLRSPGGPSSFNWWVTDGGRNDWGPRMEHNRTNFFRVEGSPFGDRSRYKMMTNGEQDYDQITAGIDHTAKGWSARPPQEWISSGFARGRDCRMILSSGPFRNIPPGDSVPFTVAFIGGGKVHTDPTNYNYNWSASDPTVYFSNLDFRDLIRNSRWADWVYDSPGIDTDPEDGNSYRGKYYMYNCAVGDTLGYDTTITGDPPETTIVPITIMNGCDSIYYKGDGIADFTGPHAPPGPVFEVTTRPNEVTLRWDGVYTETERDVTSAKRDFEGYRVYAARYNQDDQYSLITSWDKEDYRRMAYDPDTHEWIAASDPYPAEQWRTLMRDSSFTPISYLNANLASAFRDLYPDTVWNSKGQVVNVTEKERYSYWHPEAGNRGNTYENEGNIDTNLIQRVGERDTVIGGEPLKLGVYEFTMKRLQASVPLFFAVTTFDYGDFQNNVSPLESSPSTNNRYTQPIFSTDVVQDSNLKVGVYPNPYKIQYIDGTGNMNSYYHEGYEAIGQPEYTEYDRRIHFINLPDTALIRIYSLSGDLIREIHHPDPFLTTYPSSVGWDLITRNAQAVVSGIYIYRVDSRLGTQVGKIVIIK